MLVHNQPMVLVISNSSITLLKLYTNYSVHNQQQHNLHFTFTFKSHQLSLLNFGL